MKYVLAGAYAAYKYHVREMRGIRDRGPYDIATEALRRFHRKGGNGKALALLYGFEADAKTKEGDLEIHQGDDRKTPRILKRILPGPFNGAIITPNPPIGGRGPRRGPFEILIKIKRNQINQILAKNGRK
ncbi:MAG: hypothetical protein QXU06_03935 [Candidatus Bathyarchaeia archaeon]